MADPEAFDPNFISMDDVQFEYRVIAQHLQEQLEELDKAVRQSVQAGRGELITDPQIVFNLGVVATLESMESRLRALMDSRAEAGALAGEVTLATFIQTEPPKN
ncbi:MAG: hypothetical protein JWS12_461 [Candidatus Saccharibacteria bacterium]|nr:hypothetical protein [Candidatus Saccharibacteria bacterium]